MNFEKFLQILSDTQKMQLFRRLSQIAYKTTKELDDYLLVIEKSTNFSNEKIYISDKGFFIYRKTSDIRISNEFLTLLKRTKQLIREYMQKYNLTDDADTKYFMTNANFDFSSILDKKIYSYDIRNAYYNAVKTIIQDQSIILHIEKLATLLKKANVKMKKKLAYNIVVGMLFKNYTLLNVKNKIANSYSFVKVKNDTALWNKIQNVINEAIFNIIRKNKLYKFWIGTWCDAIYITKELEHTQHNNFIFVKKNDKIFEYDKKYIYLKDIEDQNSYVLYNTYEFNNFKKFYYSLLDEKIREAEAERETEFLEKTQNLLKARVDNEITQYIENKKEEKKEQKQIEEYTFTLDEETRMYHEYLVNKWLNEIVEELDGVSENKQKLKNELKLVELTFEEELELERLLNKNKKTKKNALLVKHE